MQIELFVLPNDPNNHVARRELEKLPNVSITEVACSALSPPMFVMPFIRFEAEEHRPYFGIDAIRHFVRLNREHYQQV